MTSGQDDELKKGDLTRDAFNDIRRMIFMNELVPGQKIAYRSLAGQLGMSLTPVVQALKHMEFQGLLRHEPNRGFFVREITPAEVEEVLELRRILEVSLMPRVVARADDAAIDRLQTALNDYLAASEAGLIKQRQARDINLHVTLASMADQPVTVRILRYLFDFLHLRLEQEVIFSRPHDRSDAEHRAIFEAVAARDATAAGLAVADHLESIRRNTMTGLNNRLKDLESVDF